MSLENKQVLVIGAGEVGAVIANRLSDGGYCVTLTDIRPDRLAQIQASNPNLQTIAGNALQPEFIGPLIQSTEVICTAMPGPKAKDLLKTVLEQAPQGTTVVGVSFSDGTNGLNELAKNKGIVNIENSGIAPGLPEMAWAHHLQTMQVTSVITRAGGLSVPEVIEPPYHIYWYHPADTLALLGEALVIKDGKLVTEGPMEISGTITAPIFGQGRELVTFASPGLRIDPDKINGLVTMRDETIRDHRHVKFMQELEQMGLLNENPITVIANIDGKRVEVQIPAIEFTQAVLESRWSPKMGQENATLLQIDVEGCLKQRKQPSRILHEFSLKTIYPDNSLSIMTGSTTAAVADLALRDQLNLDPGVYGPEAIGSAGYFPKIINYLQRGGVIYQSTTSS